MHPDQSRSTDEDNPSLALLGRQRSHVLFVLSRPRLGQDTSFLQWYQQSYRSAVLNCKHVLRVQHYEQHEMDITQGRYAAPPFRYLGVWELSLDGAQAADELIARITALHAAHAAAESPATWLYYPASEKVGRPPAAQPSMITVAFANPAPGREPEFREWYATRHIRHALNIPALVSGQCFERTLFQKPGALEARFATIAIYEQEGTPQDIIDSFSWIPLSRFEFPSIDGIDFAEWVYRPLCE